MSLADIIMPAPCFPVGPDTSVALRTTDQGEPSYAEVYWDEPGRDTSRSEDFRYVSWVEGSWT